MDRKLINLIGQKFGKLIPIKYTGKNKWGQSLWLCKCDCGNEIIVSGTNLKTGNTKSCGCLLLKHGHTEKERESITYKTWRGMCQRCINKNNIGYKDYGGRNPPIIVCDRWLEPEGKGFINFLNDMGERPNKNYSIDRVNNNLGYFKENCRWTTSTEQTRNRKSNIRVGELCLKDYCKIKNLNYQTTITRIDTLGWSVEKALTTPIRYKRKIDK